MPPGGGRPVEVCRRQTLVVGSDPVVRRRIRAAIAPLDLAVTEATDGRAAFAVPADQRVDGVVAADPLGEVPLPGFVRAAREFGSPLRGSGMVLVAPKEARSRVEPLIGRGANRIVDLEAIEADLPRVLEGLLRVAPRVRLAVPARIEVVGTTNVRRIFCHVVNLSTSGMLARMPFRLPIGAELHFELFLARGQVPLTGTATVVRHTVPGREPDPGIGVAFTDIGDTQAERLAVYVERSLR